ncbi:DUF1937 family protein [Roseixanthobacter pseudopolyaromaticivorans]|uniref:DUF1937 family protein n=1 Tax=Xanthobacteraceae TaxID=335928 RepID=UPI0037283EC6
MTLDDLRGLPSFVYLATPYSLYGAGRPSAAYDAARHAAHLVERGIKVFSPIVHSHHVAEIGRIDPLSHDLWMTQNEPFMRAASVLVAVRLPGWEKSVGMAMEAEFFQRAGKPIVEMEALP